MHKAVCFIGRHQTFGTCLWLSPFCHCIFCLLVSLSLGFCPHLGKQDVVQDISRRPSYSLRADPCPTVLLTTNPILAGCVGIWHEQNQYTWHCCRKQSSKAKQAAAASHKQELTLALAEALPDLIHRYQTDPLKVHLHTNASCSKHYFQLVTPILTCKLWCGSFSSQSQYFFPIARTKQLCLERPLAVLSFFCWSGTIELCCIAMTRALLQIVAPRQHLPHTTAKAPRAASTPAGQ